MKKNRKTTRLKGFDYSGEAGYFITICTKTRYDWFGRIINGIMVLNQSGIIAEKCWNKIPSHFPFIKLGAFIIMPDHIHGILVIDGRDVACNVPTLNTGNVPTLNTGNVPICNIPTKNTIMSLISPKPGSLASAIRSFKSAVSREIRDIEPVFEWQPRYYDHIIRNDIEYYRIEKYIHNNPINWIRKKGR